MNSDLRIVSSRDFYQGYSLVQTDTSESLIRVLEGFYRWLEDGGREILSRLAKNREKRKRWERLMVNKYV